MEIEWRATERRKSQVTENRVVDCIEILRDAMWTRDYEPIFIADLSAYNWMHEKEIKE
jgi:hypothetical protein